MHEAGLAQSLVEIVLRHAQQAQAQRVRSVTVEVGVLASVMPQALETAFQVAVMGTPAQEARFILVEKPGRAWCTACSRDVDVPDRLAVCPQCGSGQLLLTGGEELRVLELEVD